jgi:hypothetical protein
MEDHLFITLHVDNLIYLHDFEFVLISIPAIFYFYKHQEWISS